MIISAVALVDTSNNKKDNPIKTASADSSQSSTIEAPQDEAQPETTVQIQQEKSEGASEIIISNSHDFDLTPTEYLHNLNLSLQEVGLSAKVSTNPEIKIGEVNNTFMVAIDSTLVLTAIVDKESGNITSTTLIGSGDGTEESGYAIMLAAIASFMSAADAVSKEGKEHHSKMFFELMKQVDVSDAGNDVSNTIDGIKYTIMPTEMVGIWFITEAVNTQ